MKEPTRREFLAAASSAALAAAANAVKAQQDPSPASASAVDESTPYAPADLLKQGPQRTFTGEFATQVAMPLGGIGAGSICLNGYGGLQDFSIRTRPETTALPAGFTSNSAEAAFAVLHIKGSPAVTKLVEGPFPAFKIFDQGLQGQGLRRGGFEGFPRFARCVFEGEYPTGTVRLTDNSIPLAVTVTGWSPFIPLDDKNSGVPCVILEYALHNPSPRGIDYEFSYHLSHLAPGCKPEQASTANAVIPGKGVFLSNNEDPNAESYGSAALTVIGHQPRIKGMWLRSPGWEFDSLSALWREVSTGAFTTNDGSNNIDNAGRNGASILLAGSLAPGESRTYPIVISWHFPNSYIHDGSKTPPEGIEGTPGCRTRASGPLWRPYYVNHWRDAREVAASVESNYPDLRARTVAFKDALFSSTLPPYVLDAVSANLAILKSPTVLREENGNLWGWEGCFPDNGCCHGSCTHVWNYAQAIPNLYPQLERTLRDLELVRSMDDRGHINFRGAIPDGPVEHGWHAASDGQLGGIMKLYRDWQICGDKAWLARLYLRAKCSIDYCIRSWDPSHHGALFEPHHNTYDIEFWGPEPMCSTIYLGALSAMAQMAAATDHPGDATIYSDLAHRTAAFIDQQLFNGEYYQQRVQYLDLHDTCFAATVAHVDEHSSEMQQLLKREGPKYQYGSGCLSDGVIGAWMARIYGIDTPVMRDHVRSTLQAIFRNNFKTDLSDHANAQRPGYAMGREPGLLLCSWPHGSKPTLPFVYSDEVWTGIEYQVASHLIYEGFVTEGLTIVKALRNRYDGKTRNPWNEYECGNYYARAMASYALLGALSGFRYSAVERTLWFGPLLAARPFRSFFSTAGAYGTIALDASTIQVNVIEGELPVERLIFNDHNTETPIEWKTTIRPGQPMSRTIPG